MPTITEEEPLIKVEEVQSLNEELEEDIDRQNTTEDGVDSHSEDNLRQVIDRNEYKYIV